MTALAGWHKTRPASTAKYCMSSTPNRNVKYFEQSAYSRLKLPMAEILSDSLIFST